MFEAHSCYSFRDILITSFQCQNLQMAITQKKITFSNFSPGNLLIILNDLAKFEAHSCFFIVFEIS